MSYTNQLVDVVYTRQMVQAALPSGQTPTSEASLESLGSFFMPRQRMWSTNHRFGVASSFFFLTPRFTCQSFQIFKVALQFTFPAYLVYVLLITICFI
jgi:hypothetical protein